MYLRGATSVQGLRIGRGYSLDIHWLCIHGCSLVPYVIIGPVLCAKPVRCGSRSPSNWPPRALLGTIPLVLAQVIASPRSCFFLGAAFREGHDFGYLVCSGEEKDNNIESEVDETGRFRLCQNCQNIIGH